MKIMMMNDGDHDDTRPLSCRMSESKELLSQIAAEMKTRRCGIPETRKLYAQMSHATNTRKCPMSESMKLLTHIDAPRGHDPLEDACLERPNMQELNTRCCQIALGDHNV